MINPSGGVRINVRAVTRAIDQQGIGGADGVIVSLGAQRDDVIAGDIARTELLRPIAELVGRLLVAEPHVAHVAWLVVAPVKAGCGAKAHLAVQV